MFNRKLACSFCRRSEADVEKLVAGPHVYICDRCAADVTRIMNESSDSDTTSSGASKRRSGTMFRRFRDWLGRGSRVIARSMPGHASAQ